MVQFLEKLSGGVSKAIASFVALDSKKLRAFIAQETTGSSNDDPALRLASDFATLEIGKKVMNIIENIGLVAFSISLMKKVRFFILNLL